MGRTDIFFLFSLLLPGLVYGQDFVICTQEVKECDDGTYVGRDSANNCEFKTCPCPEGKFTCPDGTEVARDPNDDCNYVPCPGDELVVCTDDVHQCTNGAYVSRNHSNNCEFDPCPEDPDGSEEMFRCSSNSHKPFCEEDNALGCFWLPRSKKCVDKDLTRCDELLLRHDCEHFGRRVGEADFDCDWIEETDDCVYIGDNPPPPEVEFDCSRVTCAVPQCKGPRQLITPKLSCCPVCIHCEKFTCKKLTCDEYAQYTPEGSCCPTCGIDCRLVKCGLPRCNDDEQVVDPEEGECCPKCVKCSDISCEEPICGEGEVIISDPKGGCCPVCGPEEVDTTPAPGGAGGSVTTPSTKIGDDASTTTKEIQCYEDRDCPPIFCVKAPCPQNVCEDNLCVQPPSTTKATTKPPPTTDFHEDVSTLPVGSGGQTSSIPPPPNCGDAYCEPHQVCCKNCKNDICAGSPGECDFLRSQGLCA